VEYYVIENFGDKHNPTDNSNHTCYGTFESDGGTYEVWRKWRVNAPSIIGTATFPQYWSVRTKRHTGGTVNTTRHFEKWEKAGLPLGKQRDGMGESSLFFPLPPSSIFIFCVGLWSCAGC